VAVWDKFLGGWFRASFVTNGSISSSSSRKCRALVALTDWLHPSIMQLADKLLQGLTTTVKPMTVHHALMAGVSVGAANPMVHPQLAAAAGQTPDPALAAQVAGAVQQVGAAVAAGPHAVPATSRGSSWQQQFAEAPNMRAGAPYVY
jgi:hypothetical protein